MQMKLLRQNCYGLFLFLFFWPDGLFATSAMQVYQNIIKIVQQNSPYAHKLDWPKITQEGSRFIGDKKDSCVAISAAARFIFPRLRYYDHHSFITLKGLGKAHCPLPPIPENQAIQQWLAQPTAIRNKIIEYTRHFHGKHLGRLSYLYVPAGFAWKQTDINRRTSEGRDAWARSKPNTVCGFILDFRFNTGGNNVPMLLALAGLLPTKTTLFSLGKIMPIRLTIDRNQLEQFLPTMGHTGKWQLYGQFEGRQPYPIVSKPVAILINSLTGSSGAISALAMKVVQPNKTFGQPTSASTSITESIPLADAKDNYVNIMVLRIYDGHNREVPLVLPVDVPVQSSFASLFNLGTDKVMQKAVNWLYSLPQCRNK